MEELIVKIGHSLDTFPKEIVNKITKGGSKVRILRQGCAVKWTPMNENTLNFACKGVLLGTIELRSHSLKGGTF